jgi:hypothetical protein
MGGVWRGVAYDSLSRCALAVPGSAACHLRPPCTLSALVGAGQGDNWRRSDSFGFDDEGSRLVTVGRDRNHTVAVWRSSRGQWLDPALVAHSDSTNKSVRCCAAGAHSVRRMPPPPRPAPPRPARLRVGPCIPRACPCLRAGVVGLLCRSAAAHALCHVLTARCVCMCVRPLLFALVAPGGGLGGWGQLAGAGFVCVVHLRLAQRAVCNCHRRRGAHDLLASDGASVDRLRGCVWHQGEGVYPAGAHRTHLTAMAVSCCMLTHAVPRPTYSPTRHLSPCASHAASPACCSRPRSRVPRWLGPS